MHRRQRLRVPLLLLVGPAQLVEEVGVGALSVDFDWGAKAPGGEGKERRKDLGQDSGGTAFRTPNHQAGRGSK